MMLTRYTYHLLESLKIALRALRANLTRSILTTVGIVIGVVTVSLMMMIIQGLNQSFAKQISFLGSNTLFVDRHPWIWGDDWWKYINRPPITMKEYKQVKERVTLAEAVGAVAGRQLSVAFRDRKIDYVSVIGATPEIAITWGLVPDVGRFVSETDDRTARRVCVIGKDIQDQVFGSINPIGRELRIGAHPYSVVGILEEKGSTFGQSLDNNVVIPMNTYLLSYGRDEDLSLTVTGKSGVRIEDLKDELIGVMRRVRHLHPKVEDNFAINEQSALLDFYNRMTTGIYTAGLVIGGISLLVGGIGIMNIMLVSVSERTWEIGMRKAVGARTTHILWQFLIEAMVICMVGGAIGILIAAGGGLALRSQLPTYLPIWLALTAVIFSAAIGLIFGMFPAAKAARLDPIVALRQE